MNLMGGPHVVEHCLMSCEEQRGSARVLGAYDGVLVPFTPLGAMRGRDSTGRIPVIPLHLRA